MIKKQVTLSGLNKILNSIPAHQEASMKGMCEYFMQKIIQRHFQFGNATAYHYPLLDPKYLARKQRKWGNQPLLVASGLLRESVTTLYKIYKLKGKFRIVLKIPGYGKHVKNIRDFTIINSKDRKDLIRYYHTNFNRIRKRYVSTVSSKFR